ncbi:hypothetical protein [Lunatibacter salilacus]|uniref:hypothetical protein n=1 Tax=Lunatibacter salilacus TaxID=2483804 RepID=UPI00131C4FFB|nr:hypothetical protein [Lunatibacter salilacus]
MEQEITPTLKAIHICNSHQPTHRQKLQKSMSLPTLTDKQDEKEHRSDNITYTQAGVSCFLGQESAKFKVQFFVGSLVVKIPACV